MAEEAFHAFQFSGRSYDCGDKIGYLAATVAFALNNPALSAEARQTLQTALNEAATSRS
jgi:UTP--glucose-1-phosphate uridylyltransferase